MENGSAAVTAPAIAQLCTAYADALDAIERERDPIEREVGRAAHRLEATQAYARLAAAEPPTAAELLSPLGTYVAGLGDAGELAEWTVDALDGGARLGARTALRALTNVLVRKLLLPALTFCLGIASWYWLSAQQLGAAIAPVALAFGVGPFVYWAFQGMRVGVGWGWLRTWKWATTLGRRSDVALAVPRSLELALWASTLGSSAPRPSPCERGDEPSSSSGWAGRRG